MQIVINRSDLLTALKRTSAAFVKDTTNPERVVLASEKCVLIVASVTPGESKLTFGTSAGPLSVIIKSQAGEVRQSGRAVLNHKGLRERVDQMPEGLIDLTVDEQFRATIKSSSSKRKSTMTGIPPTEFPAVLDERPGSPLYSVEAKILQQLIGETAFVISDDYIKGALLLPREEKIFQLIALGRYGFVAATGWFTERFGGASEANCLLPKSLLDAAGVLPKESIIRVSTDNTRVFFETDDTLIIAAQLHVQVPSVWDAIFQGAPTDKRFRVSSDAFLSSVKAVSVAADVVEGSDKHIQIDVLVNEGQVTVCTRRSARSQGEDELLVTDAAPGIFKFHMDADLLSQGLRAFSPTELDLYYADIEGQPSLVLKTETLFAVLRPLSVIEAPPAKGKK